MTNTGQELRKRLKLPKDKFPKVGVGMYYRSNPKIYLVAFDSNRPTRSITKSVISSYFNMDLYRGDDNLDFTPFIDIDQFGGNINNAYFIAYDLAYDYLTGRYNEKQENKERRLRPFFEGYLTENNASSIVLDESLNISKQGTRYSEISPIFSQDELNSMAHGQTVGYDTRNGDRIPIQANYHDADGYTLYFKDLKNKLDYFAHDLTFADWFEKKKKKKK